MFVRLCVAETRVDVIRGRVITITPKQAAACRCAHSLAEAETVKANNKKRVAASSRVVGERERFRRGSDDLSVSC